MHNSEDGVLVDPDATNGNAWLLKDATPSDVCLNCHATRFGAVFSADPMAPDKLIGAGNFTYLQENNLNDGHGGATSIINGDAAGHNLNAPGHLLFADGILDESPGGDYPADVMSCTSCHDPHGSDTFRMLYGAGRIVIQGNRVFLAEAPNAVGLSVHSGEETNTSHTAYKSGMSAWCGNCHGDFHAPGSKLVHPSDATIGGTIAGYYNAYNGTSDIDGGGVGYLAAVPFEDMLNTTSSTAGPTPSSKVMCLTCHRAHGSSAPNAGRWDFSVTLLEEDGIESGSYPIPNPFPDDAQRSLCNICHLKDKFDRLATP